MLQSSRAQSSSAQNIASQRKKEQSSEAKPLVCIVEDNPSMKNLYEVLLKRNGYPTISFEKGLEAQAWILQHKPKLVLCDIELPDTTGMEIMRVVNARLGAHATCIIAVTANNNAEDKEMLLQNGFSGFLPKPIAPHTFVASIEAMFLK